MLSYWEQQSFLRYDHIVVGSGIVGLSTALELRERFPDHRILVLERGLLPTGASTRNAGFACMGSVTELMDDLKTCTEEDVVALFLRRREGLQLLRQRLGDAAIGYRQEGGYELILEDAASVEDAVAALNRLLAPHLGTHPFGMAPEQRAAFGFSAHKVVTMTANYLEGGLNTGRMLRALVDACLRAGIEIKTGAGVTGFEDRPNGVLVALAGDPLREPLTLESQTLCLCTNAFTRQLLPDVDVRPGRGQVLITHPIPGLRFKGIFHFDRGYYYFRELDGRVLIGGGRNLDFEGEATTSFALSERIQQDLEYWLREVILPDTPFEIDLRWSGIMAFGTTTKAPIVQAFGHRVFGGFRMGGMGVALGSATARELATLVRASVG